MNLAKLVSLSIALLLIQACSHPIDIEGMGDVVTTENGGTGTRECTYIDATATPVSDKCAKNLVSGRKMHEGGWWVPADYKETYTAVPHDGWMFDFWENCAFGRLSTEDGNECTFDVPAATVRAAWGATVPTLKAVFKEIPLTCGDGIVTEPEQCDDANTASGDGCSATCIDEAVCGDGIVTEPEQCDDANTSSGDGCSNACTIEEEPVECPCVEAVTEGFDSLVADMQLFHDTYDNIDAEWNDGTCRSGRYIREHVASDTRKISEYGIEAPTFNTGNVIYCHLRKKIDGIIEYDALNTNLTQSEGAACQARLTELMTLDPLQACN